MVVCLGRLHERAQLSLVGTRRQWSDPGDEVVNAEWHWYCVGSMGSDILLYFKAKQLKGSWICRDEARYVESTVPVSNLE